MGRNVGSDDGKRLSGMCQCGMSFRFRHLTDRALVLTTSNPPSLVQRLYTFHPDFEHG
jgi:hypothetical protein